MRSEVRVLYRPRDDRRNGAQGRDSPSRMFGRRTNRSRSGRRGTALERGLRTPNGIPAASVGGLKRGGFERGYSAWRGHLELSNEIVVLRVELARVFGCTPDLDDPRTVVDRAHDTC